MIPRFSSMVRSPSLITGDLRSGCIGFNPKSKLAIGGGEFFTGETGAFAELDLDEIQMRLHIGAEKTFLHAADDAARDGPDQRR